MIIKIIKRNNRAILLCTRVDDSHTQVNMGAQLPFHDIAHFVTERKLGIKNGFYGMIEQGYTIEQLSDKDVIKTLSPESMLAEVLARGLGSLYTRACSLGQFIPLVYTEMNNRGQAHIIPPYNENTVLEMYNEYKLLLEKWKDLLDNQAMVIEF